MANETKSSRQLANLNAALAAGAAGCKVHPCNPKNKRPLTKWTNEATSDLSKIEQFWNRFPNAMPAIVTGEASGFTVIDLDVKNGKDGVEAYKALGLDPEDVAAMVKTASGGLHLYFNHLEGVGSSVDKLAPGIDVRGEGG